jgi:hypothetical protein
MAFHDGDPLYDFVEIRAHAAHPFPNGKDIDIY